MEGEGIEHFFTLHEEFTFEPDLIIKELSDDFEEIMFGNAGLKTELWPTADAIMCVNCTQNFEDLNTFGEHLFMNPSCFFPLTKQYWYMNPDKKQLCSICGEELLDELMLKKHCFESEDCRKAYIDLYSRAIIGNVESILVPDNMDTRVGSAISNAGYQQSSNVTSNAGYQQSSNYVTSKAGYQQSSNYVTSNASYQQSSNYVACSTNTTTNISEMSNNEPRFPALKEAEDHFPDENINPCKKIKRALSIKPEIIDTVKNTPSVTWEHDFLQRVNTEQPFVKINRASTEMELEPCRTSTPDVTVGCRDSNAVKKKSLPLKCLKNTDTSQYGDKQFESFRNREEHPASSARGQSLVKPLPTLSCPCCGFNFTSEREKLNHLFISYSCRLFLKNSFLDGKFLNTMPIYDNYTLNKNMCPFCLFTADDGNVIDHVLNARKCRNDLEEAISRYHTQSSKLPTPQPEAHKPARYTCNICKRTYKTIRHLRGHKTLKHSDSSNGPRQQKIARQDSNSSDHLFCFICNKFLTSQTDMNHHQCRPTRLLSRYCYRKAVWTKDEYECTVCDEKFFYRKSDLEKHMYKHDKRTSHLFKFLPSYSSHNEILQVNSLGINNQVRSDTSCHTDNDDTTTEIPNNFLFVGPSVNATVFEHGENRKTDVSAVPKKNTFSELNKSSRSFVCENCSSEFHSPDLFKAHIMMNCNCLLHYESPESKHPVTVPFCFKCKRNFSSDREFICHQCIGLVLIIYKCALCPKIFSNLIDLRKHEKRKHKRSMGFENAETTQSLNDNETVVDETPTYQCCPCESTFDNSSQFVEHILQVHEQTTINTAVMSD